LIFHFREGLSLEINFFPQKSMTNLPSNFKEWKSQIIQTNSPKSNSNEILFIYLWIFHAFSSFNIFSCPANHNQKSKKNMTISKRFLISLFAISYEFFWWWWIKDCGKYVVVFLLIFLYAKAVFSLAAIILLDFLFSVLTDVQSSWKLSIHIKR
jgi:hypothetical protein